MAEPDKKLEGEHVEVTADTPLIDSVSEDVSAEVGDFIQQAAQQNEAAADALPDVKNKPGPYISFEHVSKSFGTLAVLKDVSFSVLPGETLCILGRSGTGKSVLLKLLIGLQKPDAGSIRIHDEEVTGLEERQWNEIAKSLISGVTRAGSELCADPRAPLPVPSIGAAVSQP